MSTYSNHQQYNGLEIATVYFSWQYLYIIINLFSYVMRKGLVAMSVFVTPWGVGEGGGGGEGWYSRKDA